MAKLSKAIKTPSVRDATVKEWAMSHAKECLRKASILERENLFSEEALILRSEAVQTVRSAGLKIVQLTID